jgi:hypothetical protein
MKELRPGRGLLVGLVAALAAVVIAGAVLVVSGWVAVGEVRRAEAEREAHLKQAEQEREIRRALSPWWWHEELRIAGTRTEPDQPGEDDTRRNASIFRVAGSSSCGWSSR